ncbi:MAG: hypothetical protein WB709_14175 [Solirubrobacteraceae bacterium]
MLGEKIKWIHGPRICTAMFVGVLCMGVLLCLAADATATIPSNVQTPTEPCPPSLLPPAPEGTQLGTPESTDILAPPAGEVIVCIGVQSITGAMFSHWAVVAQKAEGSTKPRASTTAVIKEVMGFLISSFWVIGEASNLNIHASEAEVRHTFDSIRGQQFPKRREFTEFLKSTGQTIADILFRVRLNLLSGRIQRHVLAGHKGRRGQRDLARFVRGFRRKWIAETYCTPTYTSSDCGHIKATL